MSTAENQVSCLDFLRSRLVLKALALPLYLHMCMRTVASPPPKTLRFRHCALELAIFVEGSRIVLGPP
jgi:hypothetical protein